MTIKGFYKNGYLYFGAWSGGGNICIVNVNTMQSTVVPLSYYDSRYIDYDKFGNIYVMTTGVYWGCAGPNPRVDLESIKVDSKLGSPYKLTNVNSYYGQIFVAEDHFCVWNKPNIIRRFSLYNHIIGDFNE